MHSINHNILWLIIKQCTTFLSELEVESPKFCRHAGLDPASSFIMLLELFWIPALAGMTVQPIRYFFKIHVVSKKYGLSSYKRVLDVFKFSCLSAGSVSGNFPELFETLRWVL